MADATAVIAGILSGDFNDHLIEIREAIEKLEKQDVIEFAWSVRFGDIRIDKTNKYGHGITIGTAIELDGLAGSVHAIDPKMSDRDRLKIVLAYYMATEGLNATEAGKKIGEQAFDDIVVTEYLESDVPKDGSPPETPTISAG